jgi:septum formation protein
MKKIILASASPRRRELLEKSGVSFEIITGNGEERITKRVPWEVVEELSAQKAFAATEKIGENALEDMVVIGSDTIVAFDGEILGKPADQEDAVQTLMKLQDNTHQVYTGVTLLVRKDGKWQPHTFYECTDVSFYPVSEEGIRSYVKTGEPMDKAGSYGIQGLWGIYVKGICGDYNNVVGLPVARLFQEAKKLGIRLV